MKLFPLFFFLLTIGFLSCTEDYQLRTMKNARILVVDGCITNEAGPYRIRLYEYLSDLSSDTLRATQIPVTNARVVITDNLGNRDELKPIWNERIMSRMEPGYVRFDNDTVFFKRDYLLLPQYDGSYDSIRIDPSYFSIYYEGAYYTTSITGVVGRTYTLTVDYNGKTFTASDRMPVGTTIDSVVLKTVGKDADGKGGDGFNVPFLFFAEPQDEANYYMFTALNTDSAYMGFGRSKLLKPHYFSELAFRQQQSSLFNWGYALASDRFMSAYMADYKVDDGSSSRPWLSGTDVGWMGFDSGFFDMYLLSVSETAYKYYQALSEQFYQDGGAFSPAPVSPPTNVSNGGQGFFMATSVSACRSKRIIR